MQGFVRDFEYQPGNTADFIELRQFRKIFMDFRTVRPADDISTLHLRSLF
jgi:hypothetical protein